LVSVQLAIDASVPSKSTTASVGALPQPSPGATIGGAGRASSCTIHRPVGVSTYCVSGGFSFVSATSALASFLAASCVAHPVARPAAATTTPNHNILFIATPFYLSATQPNSHFAGSVFICRACVIPDSSSRANARSATAAPLCVSILGHRHS